MKLFQKFILTEDDLDDDETFESKIFMVPELRDKDQFDDMISEETKVVFILFYPPECAKEGENIFPKIRERAKDEYYNQQVAFAQVDLENEDSLDWAQEYLVDQEKFNIAIFKEGELITV